MHVVNVDLLNDASGNGVKFILNDAGIVFFSAAKQHREVKAPGMSYEDDYRGNAAAGVIASGRVEIRFHRDFSEERIRKLWARVLKIPQIAASGLGEVHYHGQAIA